MQLEQDEPICVMDIDVLLMGDYERIFDYPIMRGQFLAMPGWWRDTKKEGYSINGGFFKYYPKDCKYIYDKFMKDIHGWQRHYIDNGVTRGPVNGEQYFVEDSVKEQLELIESVSTHIAVINSKVNAMIEARKVANKIEDIQKKAESYCNEVKPHFDEIRYHCDKLELLVDNELWPLTKYRELLFTR